LIADTYLSVGAPVQCAAPALLAIRTAMQQQISQRVTANLESLRAQTAGDSPWRVLAVEGGWYAILQAPRTRTEEEWTLNLLREDNVLAQPGFFFDFETEAFLVLSLLTPELTFQEGTTRILQTPLT